MIGILTNITNPDRSRPVRIINKKSKSTKEIIDQAKSLVKITCKNHLSIFDDNDKLLLEVDL